MGNICIKINIMPYNVLAVERTFKCVQQCNLIKIFKKLLKIPYCKRYIKF